MKTDISKVFEHENIVFAPEHYNTLGLIRALGEAGVEVTYIAIKSRYKIASYSKYITNIYYVNSIEEGYKLLLDKYRFLEAIIYTIDDKTQAYLDNHYTELRNNQFIFFNGGHIDRLTQFMNKKEILDAAETCSIKTLGSIVINKNDPIILLPEDQESYPLITKAISPISGGWKSDVHICQDKNELEEAIKLIQSERILLQKYINKKNECCLDGFVINQGKDLFIATETYYNYNIPGYYSPYMTAKTFNKDKFKVPYEKLQKLFRLIGFEGIFSMEFLLDEDGEYYFSEINFRHSTWSYIAAKNHMNLPVYWAESMLNKKIICEPYNIKDNYTAIVEPVDYLKRVVEGTTSRFKWFHDLIHSNCKFYWNWKDLKPGIYMILHNKTFR